MVWVPCENCVDETLTVLIGLDPRQRTAGEILGLEEAARPAPWPGPVVLKEPAGAAIGADAMLHADQLLDRRRADELADMQGLAYVIGEGARVDADVREKVSEVLL